MVHLAEIRIALPLTVEEFKRGQRYANWRTNEDATSEPGQGGTVLTTSPYYDDVYGEGIFTHSLFQLGNRLPDWVTRLVPASAMVVDEKSWINYPFMRTIITIPFFSKLKMEIITIHVDDDDGSMENALGLSPEDLAIRKVDIMDIGSEQVAKRDYKAELDPLLVKSTLTGRGPLTPGWQEREKPIMCAYKVVRAQAEYWGLATRAEKLLISGLRQIFLLAHKNCFGLLDQWHSMTYEEVMELIGGDRPHSLPRSLSHALPAGRDHEEHVGASDDEGVAAVWGAEGGGSVIRGVGPARKAEVDVGEGISLEERDRREESKGRVDERTEGPAERDDEESGEEEEEERVGEDEEDDDLDTEFYEAEMQWAAEEEMYGEALLSDLGSLYGSAFSLSNSAQLESPLHCPYCQAKARGGSSGIVADRVEAAEVPVRDTDLFCRSCQEFYCHTCFSEVHITERLQQHAYRPVENGAEAVSAHYGGPTATALTPDAGADTEATTSKDDGPGAKAARALVKERKGAARAVQRAEKERMEEMRRAAKVIRAEEKRLEKERREEEKRLERERKEEEKRAERERKEAEKRRKRGGIVRSSSSPNVALTEATSGDEGLLEIVSGREDGEGYPARVSSTDGKAEKGSKEGRRGKDQKRGGETGNGPNSNAADDSKNLPLNLLWPAGRVQRLELPEAAARLVLAVGEEGGKLAKIDGDRGDLDGLANIYEAEPMRLCVTIAEVMTGLYKAAEAHATANGTPAAAAEAAREAAGEAAGDGVSVLEAVRLLAPSTSTPTSLHGSPLLTRTNAKKEHKLLRSSSASSPSQISSTQSTALESSASPKSNHTQINASEPVVTASSCSVSGASLDVGRGAVASGAEAESLSGKDRSIHANDDGNRVGEAAPGDSVEEISECPAGSRGEGGRTEEGRIQGEVDVGKDMALEISGYPAGDRGDFTGEGRGKEGVQDTMSESRARQGDSVRVDGEAGDGEGASLKGERGNAQALWASGWGVASDRKTLEGGEGIETAAVATALAAAAPTVGAAPPPPPSLPTAAATARAAATATASAAAASGGVAAAAAPLSGAATELSGGMAGGGAAENAGTSKPLPHVLNARAAMMQAHGEASFSHWSGTMPRGGGKNEAVAPRPLSSALTNAAAEPAGQNSVDGFESSSASASAEDGGSSNAVTSATRSVVTDVRIVQEFLQSPASAGLHDLLAKFRHLIGLLRGVQPQQLQSHAERVAFWINVYNTLAMHAYIVYGEPKTFYQRILFMSKASYVIGDTTLSLLAIEHSILRAASSRPALAGLLPVQRFRRGDPRSLWALDRREPLITFAISGGAASQPAVRVVRPGNVQAQLEQATEDYIREHVSCDEASRTITISRLLYWYSRDFARTTPDLVFWALQRLPPKQMESILKMVNVKQGKISKSSIQVAPFDWSFCYVVA